MGRESNGEGRGDSEWCNNPSVILIPSIWIIWVWLHGKLRDVSVSVFDLSWLKRGWWNLENGLKFCQKTLKRSPKLGKKPWKPWNWGKSYLYTPWTTGPRKMSNLNGFCLISHIDAVNTCKKRFSWPFSWVWVICFCSYCTGRHLLLLVST